VQCTNIVTFARGYKSVFVLFSIVLTVIHHLIDRKIIVALSTTFFTFGTHLLCTLFLWQLCINIIFKRIALYAFYKLIIECIIIPLRNQYAVYLLKNVDCGNLIIPIITFSRTEWLFLQHLNTFLVLNNSRSE
jgi:hypothetical protein